MVPVATTQPRLCSTDVAKRTTEVNGSVYVK